MVVRAASRSGDGSWDLDKFNFAMASRRISSNIFFILISSLFYSFIRVIFIFYLVVCGTIFLFYHKFGSVEIGNFLSRGLG